MKTRIALRWMIAVYLSFSFIGQVSAAISEVEPNGTRALSDLLTFDSNLQASVGTAAVNPRTDLDYFRIVTPAFAGTTTLTATMTPTAADHALDAKVWIEDSSGTILATRDVGFDNTPETLTYSVSGSTTYYIVCSSADLVSSGNGNYTLAVSLAPKATALSWRNGTSSGAATVSSVEAAQTVYVRVDAIGLNGQSVSVSIYEYDPLANDFITTVSVPISSGFGTVAWTARWVDDGVGGGNPEFILQSSGVADSAQLTVTDTTGPSTPGLSSPSDGATFTSSSITFSWGASSDSTYGSGFKNYTLQVANNSSFSSTVVNHTGLTGTSSAETISTDGTYYWRVIAYDNNGNSTISSPSFRSFVRQTPAVTGLSWRNGTSSGAGTVSSIEAGQTVYVRVDAVGMNGQSVNVSIYEYDPLANDFITTVSVPISGGFGTAAWTARWVDDGVGGGNPEFILKASGVTDSAQLTVTDTTGPSAPTLSSPADGTTFTSSSITFGWGASSDSTYGSGFRDYTLQVANNSSFSSTIVNHTGLTGTSSAETISADGTYYWRVIAYDNNGNATVSSPSFRSFVRQTPALTSLSWRNGTSSSAGIVSTIEAGQTVYARVDAVGMNGQSVNVSIYEFDPLANDFITTISVPISGGFGTAAWTARWVDDGVGGGDPEFILRAAGVADSAQMTVTDTTGPSVSALSSPANGATLTSSSVNFNWGASSDSTYGSGFRDYTLQVADNAAFSSPTINHAGLTGTSSAETIGVSGNFYWRVIAYDNNGNSTASGARTFTMQLNDDPDDQISEATSLGTITQTVVSAAATIAAPSDVDMYSFVAIAGQRISFDIDRPSGSLAGYLRVFDGSGNELAHNSGSAGPGESAGTEAYLEYAFLSSGTYFVGVSGVGNNSYNATSGTGDSAGSTGTYTLVVSPGIAGTARVNGQTTDYLVDIVRLDQKAIDPSKRTWIVIHGRNSSRTADNIAAAAISIAQARTNDQVLTLDWSGAASYFGLGGFGGEDAIQNVGIWAATALQEKGFAGTNLNLVGHSWGSYVADELAERIPGGVNTITALDAAENVPGGYSPETPGEIDFGRDSQFSLAFHSDGTAGSNETPITADEAFIVFNSNHGNVVFLYAYMLSHPNDIVGQYFLLSYLLLGLPGPWVPDQYTSQLGIENPVGGYEAEIFSDSTGQMATNINFVSIVTDTNSINVPEGSIATFRVKLSAQPSGNVVVSISRVSGDANITLQSGSTLTFTPSNWSTYQTVTLAAAEDADLVNGTATIRCSVAGRANKDVTATESDNDLIVPTSPTLSYARQGGNLVLSWPTNAVGFTLEYAMNVPTTNWTTNPTLPVIIGGRYTVTNSITAGSKFYRLRK